MVTHDDLLTMPALQPLRREQLESTLGYYKQFIDLYRNDPTVREQLAKTYRRVGALGRATGNSTEAMESLQEAIKRYEQLTNMHPAASRHQLSLAESLCELGLLQQDFLQTADAEGSFKRARLRVKAWSRGARQFRLSEPLCPRLFRSGHVRKCLGRRPTPSERYNALSISTTGSPACEATSPPLELTALTSLAPIN